MAAKPVHHLALVKLDNRGEIVGRVDSDALKTLEAELERTRLDLKMAQRDVKTKNRKIAELERNKAHERLHHPDREFIERTAAFWHKLCRAGDKRVNPLSPMRFDAVAGLVEMTEIYVDERGKKRSRARYRPVDFEIAIRGARFDHYVKQRKNGTEQHFDDLEFICRDSKQFEECIARCPLDLARACEARNHVARVPALSPSLGDARFSEVPGWLSNCQTGAALLWRTRWAPP